MAKLTLYDLASGSFTVDLLNANFALIETALENTVSRDGTAPNTMSASLDMNSNRILNLPTAATNNEPVTLGQLLALGTLNLYTPVSDLTSLDTRLDTIEAEPTIYVQSGAPTALNHPTMQSLWFW